MLRIFEITECFDYELKHSVISEHMIKYNHSFDGIIRELWIVNPIILKKLSRK